MASNAPVSLPKAANRALCLWLTLKEAHLAHYFMHKDGISLALEENCGIRRRSAWLRPRAEGKTIAQFMLFYNVVSWI
jgi:hypothetical protein